MTTGRAFGCDIRKGKTRPRNTFVRRPMGTEVFTKAVLELLTTPIKEAVSNEDYGYK